MHEFTDLKGDAWRVSVTYGDVQRVQRETGVNLLEVFDDELAGLANLVDDLPTLVSVAACLCEDQMGARDVTAEDFAERMGGDTLEQVADAVVNATIDFFPNPDRREALRGVVGRVKKLAGIALTTLPETAFAEWDAMTESDWAERLKKSSGSAPG